MPNTRALASCFAAGLVVAGAALGQVVPTGPELLLSPARPTRQAGGTLGQRKSSALVAWQDERAGVLGRSLTSQGAPLGAGTVLGLVANDPMPTPPFQLQRTEHHEPALAMRSDESFLLVWVEREIFHQVDIFIEHRTVLSGRLMGQLFSKTNAPLGAPFQIAGPAGKVMRPAVAARSDGGFWVTWTQTVGAAKGVHLRSIDKSGRLTGKDLLVEAGGERPALGLGKGGVVLVAWERPPKTAGFQVAARLFKPNGSPVGPVLTVLPTAGRGSGAPAVTGQAKGDLLVVWESTPAGSGALTNVHGQLISAKTGKPIGAELVLGAGRGNRRVAPRATILGSGFLVVWHAFEGGRRVGVDGVALDKAGKRLGNPIAFSEQVPLDSDDLAVVAGSGRVLVAWTGHGNNGGGGGVVVRARYGKAGKR